VRREEREENGNIKRGKTFPIHFTFIEDFSSVFMFPSPINRQRRRRATSDGKKNFLVSLALSFFLAILLYQQRSLAQMTIVNSTRKVGERARKREKNH
jgi:hypothetical protein